jgi:hypothetical protein
MAAVVASLARNIFQRQRDRLRSDRVDSHDHEEEEEEEESDRRIENNNDDDVIIEEEEGSFLNDQQSGSNTRTQDESESSNTNNEGVQSFVARTTMTLAELEEEVSEQQPERHVFLFLSCLTTHSTIICLFSCCRNQQQREVARRRSSACFLFAVFVLFRMWIYALGSSGTCNRRLSFRLLFTEFSRKKTDTLCFS